VSFENVPELLDIRHLSSAQYGDEVWLGFSDMSHPPSAEPTQPYRIVRVAPGCVYPSMYDVATKGL
jgi:hypothetical protein